VLRVLAAVLAAAVLTGCASTPAPERSSLPDLAPGDTDPKQGFESPPTLKASQVLPAELRSGPHHTVDETVVSDGFMRIYTIRSDFGEFRAYGDDLLRIRVAEIGALAELREMSSGSEFAEAMAATAKSPFVATWSLVTRPVRTITGIPRGAARALERAAQQSRDQRSEFEDGALAAFFGFERDKRRLARRLGVDPYSSNPVLQEELNRIAWVTTMGSLPARLIPFAGDDEPPPMPAGLGTERVGEMLLDYPPEDMRRVNRIELSVMGVDEATRDAFIAHPWYSPLHQSQLVAHLAAMDLTRDRNTFVVAALRASSEEDAMLYERAAQLLRAYHESRAPIVRLVDLGPVVAGLTADDGLVVPLPFDFTVWTAPVQHIANLLYNARLADGEIREREILVSGTLSELSRKRMARRQIRVTERAIEVLRPAEPPAEAESS
jgi:hypothetical protein